MKDVYPELILAAAQHRIAELERAAERRARRRPRTRRGIRRIILRREHGGL